MKLTEVRVDQVNANRPNTEGGAREFIVKFEFGVQNSDDDILPITIRVNADFEFDDSSTYAQIIDAGMARARELLGFLVASEESEWKRLYAESLYPPKPWNWSS